METTNKTESTDTKTSTVKTPQSFPTRVSGRKSDVHALHANFFGYVLQILVVAIAFVKLALRGRKILEQLDIEKLVVESPHFIDENLDKESFADMIYRIPLKNDPTDSVRVFLVLEHKSYNDPLVLFQLLYYCVQVIFCEVKKKNEPTAGKRSRSKAKLPLTIPIVIYNGKGKFKGARQLKELFPQLGLEEKHLINYEPIIIDLNDVKDDAIPLDPNEIRPYIVLKSLKLLCQGFPPEKAAECIQQILPYAYNNAEYMEFVKNTLNYFMSVLNNSKSWLEKLIKENQEYERQQHIDNNNRGVNMLLSIKDQYVKEGFENGYDRGDKNGFERGVKQGFGRGVRKSIMQALQLRFSRVPVSIQKRVQQVQDGDTLVLINKDAILCQSLEEFQEKLP